MYEKPLSTICLTTMDGLLYDLERIKENSKVKYGELTIGLSLFLVAIDNLIHKLHARALKN